MSPTEFAGTIDLCNRVLRPHGPPTIAQEYPMVLAEANAAHMWIMTADDRVVSHAATYASTLELDGGVRLRVGGISSVATEPTLRQRGYASRLVQACCDDLRAQGCHFAVLWTEIKGFYEKLGFASLGSELLYRLTPAQVARTTSDAQIRLVGRDDLGALAALRAAAHPYTHRTAAEWRAYLSIPKTQCWVATRDGAVTAYVVVGKGEDFRNCAHEWAGAAGDVVAAAAHAAKRSSRRELILLAPDGGGPVNDVLQRSNVPHIRIELGMFRCLDPVGALDAVRPAMEVRTGAPVSLEPSGGRWVLHVGNAALGPMSTDAFAALLLGPAGACELFPQGGAAAERLERALPLPVFIWGLDSV